jgi:hypothetical protein
MDHVAELNVLSSNYHAEFGIYYITVGTPGFKKLAKIGIVVDK